MYLEPRQEFAQIFNEGWRNQRDYLYVPNLHGVEWQKMKEMYGQLLPYVNHRADLNYLLDNMGAEISIGHSYVRGGAMPEVPLSTAGLLGADFTIDGGRYKIARIYDNESWNPDLRAPLAAPGVDVSVGDYVLAINGMELQSARQHPSIAGRHGESSDGPHGEQSAGDRRRAADHRHSGRHRADRCARARGSSRIVARSKSSPTASSPMSTCRTPGSPAMRASTGITSRSRTRRASSSTSATTAADRPPITSSTSCSATSTATSTTSPATVCRSRARRPASGVRR